MAKVLREAVKATSVLASEVRQDTGGSQEVGLNENKVFS